MPPEKPYTTKSKDEIRKLSKDGELQTWYRIFATSAGGTFYHVDVLEDDLAKAGEALTARAAALDAI